MQTQNPDTLEENINTANRLFSESSSAMAELYGKQFQLGYDMFTSFMNAGLGLHKDGKRFNPDPFNAGIEILRKNFENISDLSRKTMSAIMNSNAGSSVMPGDRQKMAESVFEAYNFQVKQISEINQRFFKIFNETFKTTNEDIDKLYNTFRKNAEINFRSAEEAINNTVKTYTSIANQSARDTREMLDSINKQMEFLTKSNLNLWSDLLQTTGKEKQKTETRKREVRNNLRGKKK